MAAFSCELTPSITTLRLTATVEPHTSHPSHTVKGCLNHTQHAHQARPHIPATPQEYQSATVQQPCAQHQSFESSLHVQQSYYLNRRYRRRRAEKMPNLGQSGPSFCFLNSFSRRWCSIHSSTEPSGPYTSTRGQELPSLLFHQGEK